MTKYIGDHKTTAAVTASRKHVGEVPMSDGQLAKRDIDREAHNAHMESNHWGQVLKLLISHRDDLRAAVNPDSLFPGRNNEACVAFLKREAASRGASISEAMRLQRVADDRADECQKKLIALEAAAADLP